MHSRVIYGGEAKKFIDFLEKVVQEQTVNGKTNSFEMQLLKSINQKVGVLNTNPFFGDQIQKSKIPGIYNVQNLWRLELVHFWRLLYTIRGDKVEVICFVIDILDHPSYDKKFHY